MTFSRSKDSQREAGLERAIEPNAHAIKVARDPGTNGSLGEELHASRAQSISRVTPKTARAIHDRLDIERLLRFPHQNPLTSL
jgi:hypothetical protein